MIRVEVLHPNTPAPWPVALVLHGASGIGTGGMIWPLAEALAERGVAAAVVHYYDGMPSRTNRKQSPQLFAERERVLDHVTRTLLARREVQGKQVGVFGYSLGGFHAIGMAATDRRIAVAVALAGGLSAHIDPSMASDGAPLLLVHGTADRIVPFSRARIAHSAWRQAKRPVALHPLTGAGHVPYGSARDEVFAVSADYIAIRLKEALEPPVPRTRPTTALRASRRPSSPDDYAYLR